MLGRDSERALLDGLVAAIREAESRSLVLRGEAGVGKTALLEYLVDRAADARVLRAVGVESEMELAYASLHQLCGPLLDRLERLPGPQRQALETVFGLSAGAAPDQFLVGLAVLSLLSDAAEERPVLCVVDDGQWLDRASALTLAFVARRLMAERVGIVFAARKPGDELRGLPEFEVRGLRNDDARALLGSAVQLILDEQVRDRMVAETRGNPLALLELPRGLTATELAGGFGLMGAHSVPGRIEESFVRRLKQLSDPARRLLLLAAAEPVGDPLLLWRAAERLGIRAAPSSEESDGLLSIGRHVTFRHPLVRSAVYRSASTEQRQAVHLALAEATDREADPDRRAWHLAAAAPGPDEAVAVELENSAGRAQARGGLAAAGAFLERSVALSADPERRAERALAAAEASLNAGAYESALRAHGRRGGKPARRVATRPPRAAARRRPRTLNTVAATLRRCCCAPRRPSSRSIRSSHARRTWTPGARRCSPVSWPRPAISTTSPERLGERPPRPSQCGPATCCSTASRRCSPPSDPRRRRCCSGQSGASPATVRRSTRCFAGGGLRRWPRSPCGTTNAASRSPAAASSWLATPAR